jgi:ABC-type sugar transport system ATPase subunit
VRDGGAVLLISSNHEELLELSDRVLVFQRGKIETEIARAQITRVRLMESVGGGKSASCITNTAEEYVKCPH